MILFGKNNKSNDIWDGFWRKIICDIEQIPVKLSKR